MPDVVLLDNDIALKACRYCLVSEMLSVLAALGRPNLLGSARYVLHHRLSRMGTGGASRLSALSALLSSTSTVEPSDDEVGLAADLQEEALRSNQSFNVGEALLLAVLILRPADLLVTGDKRAIAATGFLTSRVDLVHKAAGKLACLEQVTIAMMRVVGHAKMVARICAAPDVDRSLSNCFGCGSGSSDPDDVAVGLHSYASAVSASAPTMLIATDKLWKGLLDEDRVGRSKLGDIGDPHLLG